MTTIDGFQELAEEFADFADDLHEAADRVDDAVERGVRDTAGDVESQATINANTEAGTELARSLTVKHIDVFEWAVVAQADHAPYVEFGTQPHVITSNDGPLVFRGEDGELVFTNKVNHPGTPAQPFLRPALREQGDLAYNIKRQIRDLFKDIFR